MMGGGVYQVLGAQGKGGPGAGGWTGLWGGDLGLALVIKSARRTTVCATGQGQVVGGGGWVVVGRGWGVRAGC